MEDPGFREFLRTSNEMYKESDGLYHSLARHYGLSDCAFWILYSLREEGRPLTQTDLCNALHTSKQTVHSALKNLETAGYIRLCSTPDDRRNKQIHLTDGGDLFLRSSIDLVFEIERRAFLRLRPQESQQLLALQQKHLQALRLEAGIILNLKPQE